MSKSFQPYFHVLRSPTYQTNGNDNLSLESLPTRIFGRIAHLAGFLINYVVTPTYTTAPTIVGMHSLIKSLVFYDGTAERYNGSFFDLRQFEQLECGHTMIPDPIVVASTSPTSVRRYLPLGPAAFEGNPTDFVVPCAALKSGELRMTFGALTDWSADTTVLASVSIEVVAVLVALDNEIRLPPAFERRAQNYGANEVLVQGRALYSSVAIAKQANSAFAAGDLSSVQWDSGLGQAPVVSVTSLTALAQYFTEASTFTGLSGEPRNATDTNARELNVGTPTALATSNAFLQTVIVSPDNSRITKLICDAASGLRIKWTGTFTSPKILFSRFLEQPTTGYTAMGARACTALGMTPVAARVKTLDKGTYKGPRKLFMPQVLKF